MGASPLPVLLDERNLPASEVCCVLVGVVCVGCLRLFFALALLPFLPLIPMLRLLECLCCVRVGMCAVAACSLVGRVPSYADICRDTKYLRTGFVAYMVLSVGDCL